MEALHFFGFRDWFVQKEHMTQTGQLRSSLRVGAKTLGGEGIPLFPGPGILYVLVYLDCLLVAISLATWREAAWESHQQ